MRGTWWPEKHRPSASEEGSGRTVRLLSSEPSAASGPADKLSDSVGGGAPSQRARGRFRVLSG
jgi:hypothetical protein